ncbi:MAG: response regulator [Phocaeicola sp.]
MNNKITIVLADDHEIFRNGVKQLINNEPDMEVIATAENGKEAVEIALKMHPTLVLMDIAMPEMNGLEASLLILESAPTLPILLFSLYDRDDYVRESLRIGVAGYILKDAPNKQFLHAIRELAAGRFFYSDTLTNVLLCEYKSLKNQSAESVSLSMTTQQREGKQRALTERELEILGQIATRVTNKELALKYGVSTRTIETHRLNIMRKLQVNTIEAAIHLALQQGLL